MMYQPQIRGGALHTIFPRIKAGHLFLIRVIGTNYFKGKNFKKPGSSWAQSPGRSLASTAAFMFELLLPVKYTRQQN